MDGTGATVANGIPDSEIEALRERYRLERDKRLRADGIHQYAALESVDAALVADPWAENPQDRAPVQETVEILIIGGGFAGLTMAAHLRKRGVDGFRIVESGADFGGTWHWNRYPGAQCDIESYIYLPLLEDTGYIPTEKYAYGPEIRAHALRIGTHFKLYEAAYFQTNVTECRWDSGGHRWIVRTNVGDEISARFVIKTSGSLDRPKVPRIDGIDQFRGHIFHTSRWDYGYTGGDSSGGLHKLSDKRVAIVGTGATSIQVVPALGRYARQLYVVQRTPSSVDVRGNRPTDPAWVKTLTPGWQQRRRENFVALTAGIPQAEDLVADGWTDTTRRVRSLLANAPKTSTADQLGKIAAAAEIEDFKKMNEIRDRVDSLVKDPKVAAALKPWYRQFCKRPTFNDDYLPTFNNPNVTLLDTDGRGLERVTETGVIVRGEPYEIDCLIFSTGFETATAFSDRVGYETYGRRGQTLSDAWRDGPVSLHGFYVHGFPNHFHLMVGQNGVSFVRTYTIEEQAKHVADVLASCRDRDVEYFEPTQAAQDRWQSTIRSLAGRSVEFQKQCTPGYYNGEGVLGESITNSVYGGSPLEFYDLVSRWRAAEDMEDIALAPPSGETN